MIIFYRTNSKMSPLLALIKYISYLIKELNWTHWYINWAYIFIHFSSRQNIQRSLAHHQLQAAVANIPVNITGMPLGKINIAPWSLWWHLQSLFFFFFTILILYNSKHISTCAFFLVLCDLWWLCVWSFWDPQNFYWCQNYILWQHVNTLFSSCLQLKSSKKKLVVVCKSSTICCVYLWLY